MVRNINSRSSVCFSLALAIITSTLPSCLSPVGEKNEVYGAPYYLQHANITVGILPSVGGLVVYLADETRTNIFYSDSSLWFEDAAHLPEMGSRYAPKLYNGHTVWLGPQSAWWAQQEIDPSLVNSGAQWPPDPYLAFGRYSIVASSDSSVRLQSPPSPVSGVQLTKEIIITGPDKIRFTASIQNIRTEPVSWDLWMNTRLDANSRVYVPAASLENISQVSSGEGKLHQSMAYTNLKGFLTFIPQLPGPGKNMRYTKMYLHPDAPYIAAFTKKHLFIKRFLLHSRELIHPEQALVELFNCLSLDPSENLLELEHHGPYRTIQPGEQLSETEEWEIIPYTGINEPTAEIEFLLKQQTAR